jgi:hypothetical protein
LTADADTKSLTAAVAKNSYGRRVYDIALERNEHGVLREMSGNEIGRQKDALVDAVVGYIADHPGEVNPNAVKFRNSTAAQEMLDVLGVKPKAACDAIQRAVKRGELTLDERQKPNRTGTYEVLVLADFGEDDEVPF